RIGAGTLLLVVSLVLAFAAIGNDVPRLNYKPSPKASRHRLIGPAHSGGLTNSKVALSGITPKPNVPIAPPDTGPAIGFEVFEAPGTLVNVTSSSQGPSAHTVEYLAHDAGEPSIGVNWQSAQDPIKGITAFQ